MAQGLARIELHDANHRDYESLHQAAENEGLHHQVKVGDQSVHMPTGTYLATFGSASDLLAKAERAAKKTGKRYSIAVAADGDVKVAGLQRVFSHAYGTV
jgi:hypothetical protein